MCSRRLAVPGLMVFVAVVLGGCDAQGIPTGEPLPPMPENLDSPQLADPDKMARVLPSVRRDPKLRWGDKTTTVPGHFAARLVSRSGSHELLLVTVDDLTAAPERKQRLSASPDRLDGRPARIARDNWVVVLVHDRYEVGVRPLALSWHEHDKLLTWFDKLDLDELEDEDEPATE